MSTLRLPSLGHVTLWRFEDILCSSCVQKLSTERSMNKSYICLSNCRISCLFFFEPFLTWSKINCCSKRKSWCWVSFGQPTEPCAVASPPVKANNHALFWLVGVATRNDNNVKAEAFILFHASFGNSWKVCTAFHVCHADKGWQHQDQWSKTWCRSAMTLCSLALEGRESH